MWVAGCQQKMGWDSPVQAHTPLHFVFQKQYSSIVQSLLALRSTGEELHVQLFCSINQRIQLLDGLAFSLESEPYFSVAA